MNKAELVKYYNDAINKVRTEKPAIAQVEVKKIDSFETSMGNVVNRLLNPIVQNSMPGTPDHMSIAKGAENYNDGNGTYFTGPLKNPVVRESDVSSINAKKEGNNYIISLTLGKATNPMNDGKDSYSRVMGVATPQEISDDMAQQSLAIAPSNLTMVYHNGKSNITVNPAGQILKLTSFMNVDANAKDAKLALFTFDVTVKQTTTQDYTITW